MCTSTTVNNITTVHKSRSISRSRLHFDQKNALALPLRRILVAFSVERFFAVVFPLYYNIFVSKKRARFVVVVILFLAALYAMYDLIEYYWFVKNNDPRCPAILQPVPPYLKRWHRVYEWSVVSSMPRNPVQVCIWLCISDIYFFIIIILYFFLTSLFCSYNQFIYRVFLFLL